MTKKEEVMNFIINDLNENQVIDCEIIYIDAIELEGEKVNTTGRRSFWMSKEETLNWIDEKYDDDLIGHCGDEVMIQILWCETILKEEENTEE